MLPVKTSRAMSMNKNPIELDIFVKTSNVQAT